MGKLKYQQDYVVFQIRSLTETEVEVQASCLDTVASGSLGVNNKERLKYPIHIEKSSNCE